MSRRIFLNLPVADVARATRFYEAMGFRRDDRFSDETTSGMALDEHIHLMLLQDERFRGFLADTALAPDGSTEVLIALDADSRDEVDATLERAVAAGGAAYRPVEDHGFMYGASFTDPDGHVWEVFHMPEPPAVDEPSASAAAAT